MSSRTSRITPRPVSESGLPPRAPRALGRYAVEAVIGVGGMGTVYRARDPVLGRPVAIKRLSPHLARTPHQRERFLREARAAARIPSPWVITIHEVGEEDGVPYIVMEYVEGDSLAEAIAKRGRFPVALGTEVLRQCAQALQAAHGLGILHRDIKPDNVLLSRDGVRITDFGIAKIADASVLTRTGEVMGTAAYMAPEQALGEPVDARSDLYSLGCVAYEMLTGSPVFESESQVGLVYRHVNEDPVPPSRHCAEIPPRLERVLLRLLAKSPSDRYPAAADLLADLEAGQPGVEGPAPAEADRAPSGGLADRAAMRFVGRGQELGRLQTLLQQAMRGRGAVCFLAGEAGVGKTRLMGELESYARRRGVRFLRGACLYQDDTVPYLPFLSALRAYFRLARRESSSAERESIKAFLAEDAPELRALVPQVGTVIAQAGEFTGRPAPEDGRTARERLFQRIAELLEKISTHRPLVVFLDDLQWADTASLKLLHYIASACPEQSMLLVGAFRTEEVREEEGGSPLLDTVQRLRREGMPEPMVLSRFSEAEVSDVLGSLLPGRAVDPTLVSRVFRESAGNALCVLELATLFREAGLLTEDDGVWRCGQAHDGPVPIPGRVRDVFLRRLERLSGDDRALLEAAAVAGDPFDAALASRVLDVKKIDLLRRLQALEKRARMIRCEPDGFHFDHPNLREILYEEIPEGMRRELHRLWAAEVERAQWPEERKVFELARHYDRAGDRDKAHPVLRAAADQAHRVYAYEERAYYLQRALATLPEGRQGSEDEMELEAAQGEACLVLGEWPRAEAACGRALEIARALSLGSAEARLLGRLAFADFQQSRWDRARERYAAALDRFGNLGEPRGVAECWLGRGNVAFESGGWDEAETCYLQALGTARGTSAEDIAARAANNLGAVTNAAGRTRDAIKWYEQGLESFRRLGDELGEARVCHNLGMSWLDLGEWETAEGCFRNSLAVSTRMRQPDLVAVSSLLMADLCLRRGSPRDAEGACLEALAIFKRRADRPGEADAYRILGSVRALEDSWEEAEACFARSLEINQACGQRLQWAETERDLGHLEVRRGRLDAARGHLETARAAFEDVGARGAARQLEDDIRRLDPAEQPASGR